MKSILYACTLVLFLSMSEGLLSAEVENYDHVHVILDTSISMRDHNSTDSSGASIAVAGQDPEKLSILSVKLLADLLYPVFVSSSDGDSLTISTFKKSYGKLPVVGNGFPSGIGRTFTLSSDPTAWEDLKADIDTIDRNARETYFYPGIKHAVDKLKDVPRKDKESRTIILVTDGDSNSKDSKYGGSPAKYEEEKSKLADLAKEMSEKHIRLYILAFGGASDVSFFEAMVTADGVAVGEVFVVNDAESLMAGMAKIFSERFGYSIEPDFNSGSASKYLAINGKTKLNLRGNSYNKVVGVLSVHSKPSIPEFELLPSTGAKSVNNYSSDDANNDTKETSEGDRNPAVGGGYNLKWLDKPSGKYDYNPINPGAQKVIILRPLNVDVGVGGVGQPDNTYTTPQGMGRQIDVIAGYPEDIFFFARTKTTKKEPPQDLVLEYKRRGKWNSGDYSPLTPEPYESASPITHALSGRWYEAINVEYPDNPNRSKIASYYEATLPVISKLSDRVVGSAEEQHAKKVLVYPYMSISPIPQVIKLKNDEGMPVLNKGENGCATFEFSLTGSYFEEFNKDISIEAELSSGMIHGQLNRASFTLDGQVIANPNIGGSPWIKAYKKGNRETLDQLTSGSTEVDSGVYKYKLCMTAGIPTEGGANKPVKLSLKFKINTHPYDRVEIIRPITVEVSVEKPDWSWWNLLWLLPFLLLLWLLKFIPSLENDLRYTYYKTSSEEQYKLYEFSPSPLINFFRRLLNRPTIYEINNISTKIPIGKIVAIENDLYGVMFDKHTKLECLSAAMKDDESHRIETRGKWLLIHVNTPYHLLLNGDDYIFRVEYE